MASDARPPYNSILGRLGAAEQELLRNAHAGQHRVHPRTARFHRGPHRRRTPGVATAPLTPPAASAAATASPCAAASPARARLRGAPCAALRPSASLWGAPVVHTTLGALAEASCKSMCAATDLQRTLTRGSGKPRPRSQGGGRPKNSGRTRRSDFGKHLEPDSPKTTNSGSLASESAASTDGPPNPSAVMPELFGPPPGHAFSAPPISTLCTDPPSRPTVCEVVWDKQRMRNGGVRTIRRRYRPTLGRLDEFRNVFDIYRIRVSTNIKAVSKSLGQVDPKLGGLDLCA